MNKKIVATVLIVSLILNPTLAHCDSLIADVYESENNKLQIIEESVKDINNNEESEITIYLDDTIEDDNRIDSKPESNNEQEGVIEIESISIDSLDITNESLNENMQDEVNNTLNKENDLATESEVDYTDINEELINDNFTILRKPQLELVNEEDIVVATDSIICNNSDLDNVIEDIIVESIRDIAICSLATKSILEENSLFGAPTGDVYTLPGNWFYIRS